MTPEHLNLYRQLSETKICPSCQSEKSISEFYKDRSKKDGVCHSCKDCQKAKIVKWNHKNPDKKYLHYKRWYDKNTGALKEYREGRKEIHNRNTVRWIKNNKNKVRTHIDVRNALRNGLIAKLPCSVCGSVNVQGHHEDYDKSLEVIWLCLQHHKDIHREERSLS
jgi:hypothetical protein